MWFIPILSALRASGGRSRKSSPIRTCRPVLEYLEDRRLLSYLSGINPNAGPAPGTTVLLFGNFNSGAQVFFHNVLAPFSGSQTSTQLTVLAPAIASGPADVKVVDPDGTQAVLASAFFALP